MTTNERGIRLIKSFEGLRLKAYLCPAGVATIGYGHTGTDVQLEDEISESEADELLRRDLAKFEAGVTALVKAPLNNNQFSALVSFAYNLGLRALQESTLLKHLNQHKYVLAAGEFLKWNKAGGKVLIGLTRRRMAEHDLFVELAGSQPG